MQKLKRFFWLCSGFDISLLYKTPTESTKYAGIGATIFFTGLLAGLAAAYAMYTVFDNAIIATSIGLIWGLMIFNLDRYIVSSMKKSERSINEFLLALPRIILAILIALVISKPLELKIFEKEINQELVLMEQQIYAEQIEGATTRLDEEIDRLKSEITSLNNEVREKEIVRDQLRIIAQEEADGTGGSKRRNLGPIYKVKKADADKVDSELELLVNNNRLIINQKLNSIKDLEKQKSLAIQSLERKPFNGLAARLDALENLSSKSEAIFLANWFIILLFIAIETAPIIVKLMASRGPYDDLLEVEEHKFKIKRIVELARLNYKIKQKIRDLPQIEKEYVDEKLSATLS